MDNNNNIPGDNCVDAPARTSFFIDPSTSASTLLNGSSAPSASPVHASGGLRYASGPPVLHQLTSDGSPGKQVLHAHWAWWWLAVRVMRLRGDAVAWLHRPPPAHPPHTTQYPYISVM